MKLHDDIQDDIIFWSFKEMKTVLVRHISESTDAFVIPL